jgi:hypothetical protein
MQEHTASPLGHPGGFRSGKPSSSLRLGHRAPNHQEKLLIGIPLKTTLTSGAVLARTLPSKPTTSIWWAQLGAILRITSASTQPSVDLKHLMRGPPTIILFEI